MSILDEAVPADETVESVKALVYGDSGAGKTTFLGSGKDNGKNDLIIAIEHGTVSAARSGSKAKIIRPKNWDELVEIVEEIVNDPKRFDWV